MNARRWARWRVRAGYPAAVAYFLLARPRPAWLAAGAAVGLIGLLVRAWAAGHLEKRHSLTTGGPYNWTRHPLYFGSLWLAVGLAVAGCSWAAAAVVALYWWWFYPAAVQAEEEELSRIHGAAFAAYAARVPRFWPRRPSQPCSARFQFRRYWQNREYRAALGFLVALLALWLRLRAQ